MPTAADIVAHKNEGVFTISPGRSVLEACRLMNRARIGSLVVVQSGSVVGMFTERDVLTRVVADEREPGATRVGDVMTDRVLSCTPESSIADMRACMHEHRVRHLPVVDQGRLIGLVSIGDLNRVESDQLRETVHFMETYIQQAL